MLLSSFFSCNVWFRRLSDIINFTLIPNAFIYNNERAQRKTNIWCNLKCTMHQSQSHVKNIIEKLTLNNNHMTERLCVSICCNAMCDINLHYYSFKAVGSQFLVQFASDPSWQMYQICLWRRVFTYCVNYIARDKTTHNKRHVLPDMHHILLPLWFSQLKVHGFSEWESKRYLKLILGIL